MLDTGNGPHFPLGRFVLCDVLSVGRLVFGRFVLRRFVCAAYTYCIYKKNKIMTPS